MSRGDDEGPVFDDDFVRAARIREDDLRGAPAAKPSRESLREVRREAKARRRGAAPTYGGGAAEPYAPRGGRVRRAVTTLAVLSLGAAAVYGFTRLPEPRRAARQKPVVVESYTPSPTPPAKDDPFAGTAVASWPTGAEGLRPPAARPVGTFSAAQVAKAYQAARAYLRAAMLDRRVLYGAQREPVYGAIGAQSAAAWRKEDFAYLGTAFRRDLAAASPVVKVNGRLKPRLAGRKLAVEFSYVGVYALRPAGDEATPAELVTIRRYGRIEFGRAGAGVTRPWMAESTYLSSHAVCGATWRHRHFTPVHLDPETVEAMPTAEPTEKVDLLDPDAPPPRDECFDVVDEL